MSHFDFKQFRITQEKCAMKVGTDGVLLGAWAKVDQSKRILDIGTGTGLIAIMAGQRSDAEITGIEIDNDAASEALGNVEACPFRARIHIINKDIRDYTPEEKFDNIISNPPYYEEKVLPPNAQRATARHTQDFGLDALVTEGKRLLTDGGLFQVIVPYATASKFLSLCTLQEMSLLHRTDIRTKETKPFKRTMLCLVNDIKATRPIYDTLSLCDSEGKRSAAYSQLTENFYIK